METQINKLNQRTEILVLKDGQVVGRVWLVSPVHVEGIWVEPEHRGNGVMKKLVTQAEQEAVNLGLTQLLAFAADEQMEDYIQRLGYEKKPWSVWQKGLN